MTTKRHAVGGGHLPFAEAAAELLDLLVVLLNKQVARVPAAQTNNF